MGESQFFHGAQPWGYHTHRADAWTGQAHLVRELDDLDRVCFDCPYPDGCHIGYPLCPFDTDARQKKRVYDIAYKLVRREVQRAEQAVRESVLSSAD